jgi:hypothetical protein
MTDWKTKAAKHLGCIAITTLVFLALNRLNELLFIQFEHSNGINWVFLPAGIRLLATLLFGFAGFEGLLLAGFYLNFHHFSFPNDGRAWSGAFAGALGPYLAYLFAKHWFNLGPRLRGLTVPRLLFTGVLCGVMSPVFHHAFMWVQTGLVDWPGLVAMIIGDSIGILIVLGITKGLMTLVNRHDRTSDVVRRWMP